MIGWTRRRWATVVIGSLLTAVVIGVPTDVIPNPVFGRSIGVTWWSYPALVVTSLLSGLVAATYVREPLPALADTALDAAADGQASMSEALDTPTRTAGIGGLLSFFAVGCPVCNKLVLIALGTTGAVRWFEPIQPLLALASITLLSWALRARLRSATACSI